MNYRITIAYDGTAYAGWQLQEVPQPTVQGELNAVLARLAGEPVTIWAAGRTDKGVHALGQVASFQLAKEWSGWGLCRALNANLPADIRVMAAERVADDFHARLLARAKSYRYQLWLGQVMNPLLERYVWHYPYAIDLARLCEDAAHLQGTHNFNAFTVADCTVKTRVRTITDVQVATDGDLLTLTFCGTGFLRYQVRTMVAALIEANRGRLAAASIQALLAGGERQQIGAPAPAKGLTLLKVEY